MSFATWVSEFYPVPADEAPIGIPAIEHSLRKWRGLSAANLDKHSVKAGAISIWDDEDGMGINSRTCALCHHYYDGDYPCQKCPIVVATKYACDGPGSPFAAWHDKQDEKPMIALLEETLAHAKAEAA